MIGNNHAPIIATAFSVIDANEDAQHSTEESDGANDVEEEKRAETTYGPFAGTLLDTSHTS